MEMRRNASAPLMGLPRLMPRTISMCLPPGKRAFAAETEGVQSWDEYQSIRDAQVTRRPAARRCLEDILEVAARAHSFPLTRAQPRRGEVVGLEAAPHANAAPGCFVCGDQGRDREGARATGHRGHAPSPFFLHLDHLPAPAACFASVAPTLTTSIANPTIFQDPWTLSTGPPASEGRSPLSCQCGR